MEALAAIERLIKKRIERVLVPGLPARAARTVATLMGDQPRSPRRERGAGSRGAGTGSRQQGSGEQRGREQGGREQGSASSADPIFSKPYEPAAAAAPDARSPPARKTNASSRRSPPCWAD